MDISRSTSFTFFFYLVEQQPPNKNIYIVFNGGAFLMEIAWYQNA